MGKSNRIRADRSSTQISNSIKHKKKTGMPIWAKSLIAAVVAVVILASCVFGLLSSNGVFMRYNAALSTENYKISGNMMSYFFQTQYQNFYSQYQSYMSYFSLDTTKSLKEQKFGDTSVQGKGYETSFLGEFDGTWFDYFMNSATESATQILIYCEEADVRGIKLDDEDLKELETSIETIETTAAASNYSTNAYIAQMYGTGVKMSDIKKAMKLSMLAQKCMLDIQEEIQDSISDEDINTAYNASKLDFNLVDYVKYNVSVKYEDVAAELLGSDYTDAELKEKSAEVLLKYAEKITAAKADMKEFEAAKTADDFKLLIYKKAAEAKYDTEYAKIDLEDGKTPDNEDTVKEIKKFVIDAVAAEIAADKENNDPAYTADGDVYKISTYEVTKEYAEAVNEVKIAAFEEVYKNKESYVVEKATYTKDDDFSEWAFEDGRAADDIKTILEGDGSEDDSITKDEGSFSASVYFLTKAQYKDESLSKNVSYMVFTSEDLAIAAIEAFAEGTISKEAFEAIATEKAASANSDIEDYTKGALGVDAFDKWLFDDETVIGSYTKEPISADSSSYIVAYYHGDGEANWKLTVEASIFNEEYTKYYDNMQSTYTVKVKEKILNKVGD